MGVTEGEAKAIHNQGQRASVAWMLAASDEITELTAAVTTLVRRVDELERRDGGANSRNSSKPPSQDPFKNKGKKKARRRRRKGHRGGGRELLPISRVDELHDVYPDTCRGCGSSLTTRSRLRGAAGRYQQMEIPDPRAVLTEWRVHSRCCDACGCRTRGDAPAGAAHAFGPRLHALVVTMVADKRMTTRQIQQFLADVHGVDVSLGAINAMVVGTGAALSGAAEAVKRDILVRDDVVGADETSWPTANHGGWLWGLFGASGAYYAANASRDTGAAMELIPPGYGGVVTTDCYGAYNFIPEEQRQVCWAHLLRHFRRHAESDDAGAREFGERGLAISARVFRLARDRGQPSARQRADIRADVHALIGDAADWPGARGAAATLRRYEGSLWHCLDGPAVGATNNAAERGLRPAVIKRKLSFGSASERGAAALANLLTVVGTARLRGVNPYEFVEKAVACSRNGQKMPILA